ncbi:MAG: C39 family peptidase [Vallitaleaceae bacterium]|nr:C39 family peptidase [Vallitaleaceae bacterium]
MKSPLNYQITEYDCGPTTLNNAINYLFNREDIPPDIIKHIMLYSMDAYNSKGEFGKNGTSGMAMMFLSSWLKEFGKVKKFPIQCEYLTGPDVTIGKYSKIVSALRQGGAIVVRLRHGWWHYALLTGVDEQYIYLFDPYYRKKAFVEEGLEIIADSPFAMNRKIAYHHLNSEGKGLYALGPVSIREATILFNTKTRKLEQSTLEYFI